MIFSQAGVWRKKVNKMLYLVPRYLYEVCGENRLGRFLRNIWGHSGQRKFAESASMGSTIRWRDDCGDAARGQSE